MSTVDARLLDAARESVNFGPLAAIEPLLTIYGAGAEASVYTDPNGALIKCRQFGEVLAVQLIPITPTRMKQDFNQNLCQRIHLRRVGDRRPGCGVDPRPLHSHPVFGHHVPTPTKYRVRKMTCHGHSRH